MSSKSESELSANQVGSVAIIGAGLAGLSCAKELLRRGYRVHVFEKCEFVSGRMARIQQQLAEGKKPLWFDHGAQYFTARSPEFSQQVYEWEDQQVVQEWHGPFVALTDGVCGPAIGDDVRYVGIPGMDALCVNLAQQCFEAGSFEAGGFDAESFEAVNLNAKLTLSANVLPLQRMEKGWQVRHENPQTGTITQEEELFDAVVLAVPSALIGSILPADSPLIKQTQPFKMGPCLAVLLAFDESLSLPYGGAFVQDSPLRWISNNSSMPQRDELPERWILHSSSEWSAEHWEDCDEKVLEQVCAAFEKATANTLPESLFQALYRWEDALPLQLASQGYFSDAKQRVVIAGDWCTDARVEGAYLSGLRAARHLADAVLKDQ